MRWSSRCITGELRECCFAGCVLQRSDDKIKIASDYIFELVNRKSDAVIRDASLGKIVGTDTFGPVSGAYL